MISITRNLLVSPQGEEDVVLNRSTKVGRKTKEGTEVVALSAEELQKLQEEFEQFIFLGLLIPNEVPSGPEKRSIHGFEHLPTTASTGSYEKVDVMVWRHAVGLPLWHEDDNPNAQVKIGKSSNESEQETQEEEGEETE